MRVCGDVASVRACSTCCCARPAVLSIAHFPLMFEARVQICSPQIRGASSESLRSNLVAYAYARALVPYVFNVLYVGGNTRILTYFINGLNVL